MEMKPNPQCSNSACLERQVKDFDWFTALQLFICNECYVKPGILRRALIGFLLLQKEYILAKPARDAAAREKMSAEVLTEGPLHEENEWNIR